MFKDKFIVFYFEKNKTKANKLNHVLNDRKIELIVEFN